MNGQTLDASTTHYLNDGPVTEVFTPDYGDYFVFRIDPVASVAHLDEVAKEDAARLPRRFYVARLNMAFGRPGPAPQRQTNHCNIKLLRQGPPSPRLDFLGSSMCVPVQPNAMHPFGREPLKLTRPLPWSDCYHDTLGGVDVRITTAMRPYSNVIKLPPREREYLCRPIDEDEQKMADSCTKTATVRLVHKNSVLRGPDSDNPALIPRTGSLASLSRRSTLGQTGLHSNISDVSMVASGDNSEVDTTSALHSLDTIYDITLGADEESLPVVDVWYDLSMVSRVTDPVHFYEDQEALKRISAEAYARRYSTSVNVPSSRHGSYASASPRLHERILGKSFVLILVENIARKVRMALRKLPRQTHYRKLRELSE